MLYREKVEKAREAVEREERERRKIRGRHEALSRLFRLEKERRALLQFARDDFVHHDSLSIVDDDIFAAAKRRRSKYFQIQTPNSSNTTRSRKISMFTGRTSKM